MQFYHEAGNAKPRQFRDSTIPGTTTSQRDTTMDTTRRKFPAGGANASSRASKEFKFPELAMLSISPIVRSIHHWWLQRAERHYLICADVEQQRAREAQMNVAYYQKRAALARSARL